MTAYRHARREPLSCVIAALQLLTREATIAYELRLALTQLSDSEFAKYHLEGVPA